MIQPVSSESEMNTPETRMHQIALAASRDPLRQLPLMLAFIPGEPRSSLRLASMLTRYNEAQFDRLTGAGYRLNFLTETYEKTHV
ncbi:MAG: hypothetical protein FJ308_23205 [Planctomycetes bacterium]|nr:hypothetical protein [Planctomycetota bacterium]